MKRKKIIREPSISKQVYIYAYDPKIRHRTVYAVIGKTAHSLATGYTFRPPKRFCMETKIK